MIIVVGAGPAGLATAYYLEQRGLPYLVLEREAIGYAWRNHYESLHLNTLKQVSALPGLPMPEAYPDFPSAEQFVAYLESYACHFDLNVETGVEVLAAEYEEGEWRMETSRGEYRAKALIVATGIWSTPFVPPLKNEEAFEGKIVLARDYRNPEPFAGKRVLVVGLGNSAADIAVELAESGAEDVGISIRDGAYFVEKVSSPDAVRAWSKHYRSLPEEEAERQLLDELETFEEIGIMKPVISPLKLNAVVGFRLPDAVRRGDVEPYPCLTGFTEEGAIFDDGSREPFDAVILATGYRPTVDFIQPYMACDRRGYPQLRGYCSVANPHLYAIGFDYPVFEGFLQSLSRVARELVDQLAAEKAWIEEEGG